MYVGRPPAAVPTIKVVNSETSNWPAKTSDLPQPDPPQVDHEIVQVCVQVSAESPDPPLNSKEGSNALLIGPIQYFSYNRDL